MNIPNLERRTKELVRDWAKGWVSFQPSENALQCLEAGVTEALRQTREEAYHQGRLDGLEEARRIVRKL